MPSVASLALPRNPARPGIRVLLARQQSTVDSLSAGIMSEPEAGRRKRYLSLKQANEQMR